MHVVLIHRYFWPDTPLYASLLRRVAEELVGAGHRVTVLSTQPSYTGSWRRAPTVETLAPGVEVRRVRLLPETRSVSIARVVNVGLFALRIFVSGLRLRKVDVVMAATAPPIVAAQVGSVLARVHRAAFVYHNQDIYPEVALAAGVLRRPWLGGVLRRFDARSHRRAVRTVVLSSDMRRTIEERGVPGSRIAVINNFDPFVTGAQATASPRRHVELPLRVTFAGNLGRFQGLEAVIVAATRLRDEKLVFDFIGDGVMRPELEAEVRSRGLENVRFHGFWPARDVERFLAHDCDVGLIALAPGVIRCAYPSKAFSYLRNGCPLVAMVERDSELANTVSEHNVGYQCDPGDGDTLSELLRSVLSDPGVLDPMRARAAELAAAELSPRHRLRQWRDLFDAVASERARVK